MTFPYFGQPNLNAYGWLHLRIGHFGESICYFGDRSTNSFNLRACLKSRVFAMPNPLYSKLVV
ncbi:MAG: hypothetical protein ACYTX0_03875 [Nostoc sp.]